MTLEGNVMFTDRGVLCITCSCDIPKWRVDEV